MRKRTVLIGTLIAAGIGISAILTYVAAHPTRVSTAKPAIATMSPLEIMKQRGKDLPPAENVEPF
jgi:hypothetical protein